ncbi:hypothetical protein HAZT_HAZT010099 [Hyalella azteca]|uniref:Protein SPT2 homolog n=1 Tax=Hyalella azteca TaxID=294128 RepID=A0A6A0GZL9_HYAAZ|nr:hypothetical protein HAZT_HAZT010099 [Hyalella azteca]
MSRASTSCRKEVRSLPCKDAVQAVLEKKRKAEQQEAEEFRKNREKLLELRSLDKKANKRVKAMITRTKGFNKSVLEEAKDLTTARGEQQCDEDDYGYESTMSQQIFDKLTTQYSEMPEDERLKFKKVKADNIADVKSRVMSSLKKQEEDEQGPRKRKRKNAPDADDFINDGDPYDKQAGGSQDKKDKTEHKLPVNLNLTNYQTKDNENFKYDYEKKKREEKERVDKENEREEKRKKRKLAANQPPALGFAELMKLAATKLKDTGTKKGEDLAKEELKEREALVKKKLSERPLTAQEKAQQEDDRLRKLRRLGKLPNLPIEKLREIEERRKNKNEANSSKTEENMKNDKETNDKDAKSLPKKEIDKNNKKVEPKPEVKVRDRSKYFAIPGATKPSVSSSTSTFKSNNELSSSTKVPETKNLKPLTHKPPDVKPSKLPDPKAKFVDHRSKVPDVSRDKMNGPSSSKYKTPDSKARPPSGSSSGKNLPPTKSNSLSRPPVQPTSSGLSRPAMPNKSRQFPPADMKPLKKPSGGRYGRVDSEDEDSEYDSEMDDFIDDGEPELDYSSEISKMFRYDRSKFKDEPDDVDDMEVGFSQVEKEEMRSAKIGLLEDLEDMKQEEAEKKRKMLLKKKMMKSKR